MNQPSIFISCVSPEFRSTRAAVATILTRLGYLPVVQEIFGTEGGDLRQVLRDKIDACEGLIQIVGDGYGSEPPTPDAEFGRVSYTQFEFLYASKKGKKTWLIFADKECKRDTPFDRLDLPHDPAHPDPLAFQAERRQLQAVYRQTHTKGGHLRHSAANDSELALKVEQLKDELAALRRAYARWQNKVAVAIAGIFLLLLLIGGGVWWSHHRMQQGIIQTQQGIARLHEDRKVTRENIRAHLTESAEKIHQAALAEAGKATGWQDRQRLREAAEKEHAARLSRIDELSASFAEIEGTARATAVFDEMTRILSTEGVEQALAYIATQRTGILDKVKARIAAAREKNRTDLLPLLKSAELQADHNQPAEASRSFAEILAMEPDWPDALHAQLVFLINQGDHAFHHTTLEAALSDFTAAETNVQRLLKAEPEPPRARRDLAVVSNWLGDALRRRGQPGDAVQALKHYQLGLELVERLLRDNPQSADAARDVAISLNKLSDFLASRGQPGDAGQAFRYFQRALEISERLLRDDPKSADSARDVAVSLNELGDFLAIRGQPGDAGQALSSFQRALEISERLLRDHPQTADAARDVAVTLNKLGDALARRGQPGDAEQALGSYQRSLELCEHLLQREIQFAVKLHF